jgi:hypothetical protein
VAALGAVAGVALLVMAVLVGAMRLSGPPMGDAAGGASDEPVPTSLAGGLPLAEVPPTIEAVVDLPVVGALVTDVPPEGLAGECGHGAVDFSDPATRTTYVVTPDLAETVSIGAAGAGDLGLPPDMAPPPGEQMMEQCSWQATRGGWTSGSGMSAPVSHGHEGGSSMSCCDGGYATASTSLPPPQGATWALQERGSHWLAYPVEGLRSVPFSWRYRQGAFSGGGVGSTHILWVDDAGELVEERFVSG